MLRTRVNGQLTKELLNAQTAQSVFNSLVGVFLEVKVQSSGSPATFEIQGVRSAKLWVDGVAVEKRDGEADEAHSLFETKLKSGEHTVLVRINAVDIPKALLIQSDDVTFGSRQ